MLFRSTIPPEFPGQTDTVSPDSVWTPRAALRDVVARLCHRVGAHVLCAANGVHPANFFDVAVSHEIHLASRIHTDPGT